MINFSSINNITTCYLGRLPGSLLPVIRIITFWAVVLLLHISTVSVAQNISLSEKKAPLGKIFKKISQQSGYDFFVAGSVLKTTRPVTIRVRNVSLQEVLERIFINQPVTYTIEDKTIIVKQILMPGNNNTQKPVVPRVTIKGRVIDEKGKALGGVTILDKITKEVMLTDAEGNFRTSTGKGHVLIFSFIGYATKEIRIDNDTVLHTSLRTNVFDLNQVIVVGYGTIQRKDLTGSAVSVKIDDIKKVPFATIDQALTGKASGVQVVQSDGSPGGVPKIRIRGGTSLLGGNDPLYVIDGVQVQVQNNYLQTAADVVSPVERGGNGNPNNSVSGAFARSLNSLSWLNINDIESIDILKDASASAIYGSRAANGVVTITTKKGRYHQKALVELNYYTGVNVARKEKLLNRDQYIMIVKEGANNLNAARSALSMVPDITATRILNDPGFFENNNTDWLDLVLRTGIAQNADISIRGGTAATRYYSSLSFNKTEGTVRGTDFKKIAGKIGIDHDISSNVRISSNINYGFTGNNITNGVYTQALYMPPTFSPYNADGTVRALIPESIGASAYQGFQNPLSLLQGVNRTNTFSLLGSIAGEYDIIKGLKFRSSLAGNLNSYHQDNYIPGTVLIATTDGTGSSGNGTASRGQSHQVDMFYENTLSYTREFNANSRVNMVAGTSWQTSNGRSYLVNTRGFTNDNYPNNLSSATIMLPGTNVSVKNSLLSFYGRINYALYDRYLFTVTGRSDASSKFPKNNRVAFFPSGGIAWRLSEEKFLKKSRWIGELKLRASAGYTGTQNIGNNLFHTLYSPVSYAGATGWSPSQLGNNMLQWEQTLQKDAGIEFEIIKDRIRGGLGYYSKITSKILYPMAVATSAGFARVTANIADIRNRGMELDLSIDYIREKNFHWAGSLNISGNRSRVLSLPANPDNPGDPYIYIYNNAVLIVGQPVGLLYGPVFDGILYTQKDVDNYRTVSQVASNSLTYLSIGDARYKVEAPAPGAPATPTKWKNDIIGRAQPTYFGGYTNTLRYKSLEVVALVSFAKGGDVNYLADAQNIELRNRTNKGVRILERWTPENAHAIRPKLVLGESGFAYSNSSNVYDASFIKLKSVIISYRFPKYTTGNRHIKNVCIYISGINLLMITRYPGADPEVSNNPYSLIDSNSDSGGYPTVRQYSFGLRCEF